MRKIILKIDDDMYDAVIKLFSMFPKNKIEIIEESKMIENKKKKLLELAGSLKSLPIEPLKYQRKIRDEWK